MASHGKKKTTMAKLNREARLRERRVEKAARKTERKLQAELGPQPDEAVEVDDIEAVDDELAAPVEGEEVAPDPSGVGR